jgi:pyruvate dehydrogenase E1 component alpha subunit
MTDLTAELRLRALRWMRLTRALDDRVQLLHKQSRIVGGCFSQLGHEAISVGAALALGPGDVIAPMHRDLGAYLVRGMTPRRIMAQYFGRAAGVSGGRDANTHGMGDLSLGIFGFVSSLPASMPVTLGAAHAFKIQKQPHVALTFFGDGSSSEGLFHEVLNWATVFQVPAIFICENNQYAYSTPTRQQMRVAHVADRAAGYGLPRQVIDGNDLAEVYRTVAAAVEQARAGGGPALIECVTMRMRGHAIHDNMAYVPAELITEWQQRDPLTRFEAALQADGLIDAAGIAALIASVEAEIDDAIRYAEQCPYPEPSSVTERVYAMGVSR